MGALYGAQSLHTAFESEGAPQRHDENWASSGDLNVWEWPRGQREPQKDCCWLSIGLPFLPISRDRPKSDEDENRMKVATELHELIVLIAVPKGRPLTTSFATNNAVEQSMLAWGILQPGDWARNLIAMQARKVIAMQARKCHCHA